MDRNPRTDSMQRAIAVVTAWLDQEDEPGGSEELHQLIGDTQLEDQAAGAPDRLVVALSSLAGLLATNYAAVSGTDPRKLLTALSLMIEEKDI